MHDPISHTRIESDYGGDLNHDYGVYYLNDEKLPETEVMQKKQETVNLLLFAGVLYDKYPKTIIFFQIWHNHISHFHTITSLLLQHPIRCMTVTPTTAVMRRKPAFAARPGSPTSTPSTPNIGGWRNITGIL